MGTKEPDSREKQESLDISPIGELSLQLSGDFPELTAPVEFTNLLLYGLWRLHDWARIRQGTQILNSPQFSEQSRTALDFIDQIYSGVDYLPGSLSTIVFDKFVDALGIERVRDVSSVPKFLPIKNEVDFGVVLTKLGGHLHDTKARTRHIKDANKADIPLTLKQLASGIEDVQAVLLDQYAHFPYAITSLIARMHWVEERLDRYNIKMRRINLLGDRSLKVVWSRHWFDNLMENIIQNTIKAYRGYRGKDKKLVVFAKEALMSDGSPAVDFIFEDSGPGFPGEIIKHGFRTGQTRWPGSNTQGTGIGMAYGTPGNSSKF